MAAKKTTSGSVGARGASLTPDQRTVLLATLKDRFTKNMRRHTGVDWKTVQSRLDAHPGALQTLYNMEQTGGEPDVVGRDAKSGAVIFCDCAAESPADRRSLCFDRPALDARKENKPRGDAVTTAVGMGVDILTEAQYRDLQTLGEFIHHQLPHVQ